MRGKALFLVIALLFMLVSPAFANSEVQVNWAIEPQYEWAQSFEEGFAVVSTGERQPLTSNLKLGLINTQGELVVPMEYDWIGERDGKLTVTKKVIREEGDEDGDSIGTMPDGTPVIWKSWTVDVNGNLELLKPVENRADWTFELFAGKDAVLHYDVNSLKYGVINRHTGKVIIPFMYDVLRPFSEGYAIVWDFDKGKGIIDKENRTVLPMEYDYIDQFINDQLLGPNEPDYHRLKVTGNNETRGISKDGKWGMINRKGEWVVPLTYDSIIAETPLGNAEEGIAVFNGGLAAVYKDGKWGAIDVQGNLIVPIEYEYAFIWDGYASVKKNGWWGCLDKNGNIAVPLMYDYVGAMSEGMAIVSLDSLYGAVDSEGNLRIPCIHDWIGFFNNGYAPYGKDGKYGFINKDGDIVVPAIFDNFGSISYNLALVQLGGKWGYVRPVAQNSSAKGRNEAPNGGKRIHMRIGACHQLHQHTFLELINKKVVSFPF